MTGHLLLCGPLMQVSTISSLICFILQQPNVGSKIVKKWASPQVLVLPWCVGFGQTFDLPTGSESGNSLSSGNWLSLFSPYSSSIIIMFSLSVNSEDPKLFVWFFFLVDMSVFLCLSLLIVLQTHATYSNIHLDISQEIVLANEISFLNQAV